MNAILSVLGSLGGWNISVLLLLAKATIILIAALGITLAMQRSSATARHLVWLVTLGMLLFVPVLSAWPPLRLAILPATAREASPTVAIPAQTSPDVAELAARARPPATAPTSERPAPPKLMTRLYTSVTSLSGVALVVAIWAVVALAILASLTWAGFTVQRIVRRARPLTSPDWETPLFEIADRLGLEEAPRLLQSDDAKMPFACGMMTPTIVLPAESEQWSLDRRRAVLLHELAHVRRHDLIGHTLGRFACAAYWFHPLVWTAAKRLRSESERACDDLALACGTRATDYAEHLLDIVTSVRGDSTPLVALAMARRKEFEGRMLAILDPHLRRSTPSRTQSAALIATLVLVSLTVSAVSPVPREARAAVVQPASHAAEALRAINDASLGMPVRATAYADTGARGVRRIRVATDTVTSQRTDVTQIDALAESVSTATSSIETNAASLSAIASAGARVGMSAASAALRTLGQISLDGSASGRRNAKGPDDRAILLAKVLRTDSSASLRRVAAWGLQEYTDTPVAEEALVAALRHDSSENVREMAAWSLSNAHERTGGPSEALLAALKGDASDKVRATAAWALGSIGDRGATDGLAAALSDASSSVRLRAAWAIGSVEPRTAPKPLVALLGDKDPRTRQLAAWALFSIEDPSTVPALESALKSEQDKDVQLSYIRALAAMGEKSVDALRGLLESSDPRIKSMAVHALAGGHAAGPWPWPWPEPRPFP